ncbi:extensin family protein [Blastochloris tepida]|uniref:extensin-like domain-containing protein n=1 Tax=Blastochloris tepida TaxID=2233851 RepID=UPI0013593498|nr:extensin family protein [Blastochloris tepida]
MPLHKAVFAFATLPVETGLPGGLAAAGVLPLPPQHALSPWSIAAAPPALATAAAPTQEAAPKTALLPKTALAAIAAVAPLPRPRPALPQAGLALASIGDQPAASLRGRAADVATGTSCRNVFALGYAEAKAIAPVKGSGACGTGEAVELSAVTLADGSRVAIEPAATLNCRMAEGLARWVREDLAPSATRIGQPFKALKNFASYDCRGRNRNPYAMMSEHGRANAIDIRGFESTDGRWRFIDSPDMPKALMAEMKRGACERFMTVLGPGSDGYHENHIHVDLAERANGRKLCGWKMDEPLVAQGAPKAAPKDAAKEAAKEAATPSPRLATARAPLAPVKPRPPAPASDLRPAGTQKTDEPPADEMPAAAMPDAPERIGFAGSE